MAMKADGTRIEWGGRRNNCFTDADFQRVSKAFVEVEAKHYANHPNVIGWQIDNELGGTDCRCDKCRAGFQKWLKEKYGTLDELNRAWGTHFWSQKLQTWDEIPLPVDREGDWAISNPSMSLDWKRFTSNLEVDFLDTQVKILRTTCSPSQFITHNCMGLYNGINYYDLAKPLDFVSWDNYPKLAPAISYESSLAADVMRLEEAEFSDHGANSRTVGLEHIQPQSATGRVARDLLSAVGPWSGRTDLVPLAFVHGGPRTILARPARPRRQTGSPLRRSGESGKRISAACSATGWHHTATARCDRLRL